MTHRKALDTVRRRIGPLENDLIDELLAGRIDRRAFLRHGSMLGLSLPLLGGVAGMMGLVAPRRAWAQGKAGSTIKVGIATPAGAVDPITVADDGGLTMLIQAGEFLCVTQPDLTLKPALAESWSHNDDSSVWTFKLRPNVKFISGGTMKAEDVIASIDRLADPANASNALSAFKGILSKGNSKKVDDLTVEFHLDAPYGAFPYVVSSDNYNCIILPATYKGDYEKNWDGTGPFKLEKFTQKVGASFVRNDDYWGEKALPARTEFSFFDALQPRIIALQSGQIDLLDQVPVIGGQALLNDPNITVIREKSSAHQQVHMRCDTGPLADKRIRQAIALSLDRKKIVAGLLHGYGEVGNDSPFAPAFPSTATSVPQRQQDLAKAKQLVEAAAGGTPCQGDADHRDLSRDPAIRRADPELRPRDRRRHRPQDRSPGCLLRQGGPSASRTGSTARWASPTTAIVACPTSSCARRCSATGRGMPRISRTRTTTGSSTSSAAPPRSARSATSPPRSRRCCSTRRRSSSAISSTTWCPPRRR